MSLCKKTIIDINKKVFKNPVLFECESIPLSTSGLSVVKRVALVDKLVEPKYKFFEMVNFVSENEDFNLGRLAVCIGFNPASAEKKLDMTNKRLINALLLKNYKGYLLYNLFPEITFA